MLDVIVDTASLDRSTLGGVTGRVFLRGATGDFPEGGWSDFPVVVLGWWIEGLTAVVARREHSFRGMFMDGPLAFVIQRGGRIAWGKVGQEVSIGIVDVLTFLRSAVAAGRTVAAACRARRWSSPDLQSLERAIARSAV
jgi:hypothetical protein